MSESVNGLTVYVTDITGTATSYIRESVVSTNTADKTNFDTWETAENSVAGTQLVDFAGGAATGNATGLANDATAYTATIAVDGVDYAVSVTGSAAQTFGALVTEINADLPNTECAIDGDDNLLFTSTTTGDTSKISITDVDLFSSLTGFVAVDAAVDGNLATYLTTKTLTNGANAWEAYKGAVEVYDTAADATVITTDAKTDYTTGDLDIEAEIIAAVNATNTKVNSLQDLVERIYPKTRTK